MADSVQAVVGDIAEVFLGEVLRAGFQTFLEDGKGGEGSVFDLGWLSREASHSRRVWVSIWEGPRGNANMRWT